MLRKLSADRYISRFRLASLSLDAILQETTVFRRRERLRVITDGLNLEDAYGVTLDRIKAQGGHKSRLGMAALMWICHSERQLRAEELCQALAVEIGSTDCNVDDAPSIQTVLSYCQGFVVVDKERSTVQLIHHTLQEYLVNHQSFFQYPHIIIAETCLTYLNSQQVMDLTTSFVQCIQNLPFLQYSALYWGVHIKDQLTDVGKALALKLLSDYTSHISIRPLLEHTLGRSPPFTLLGFHKFTGLHCASVFGLVEIAKALIMMDDVDINATDETGATPLLWAAMNGHEVVVKLLLGRKEVNPDRPDNDRRTPISWAAGNGHEAVVRLLLGRKDVDPNRVDIAYQTPILLATENGHEAVVKLLLEREDVNPDVLDRFGRTSISLATQSDHEEVVELLLEREAVAPDWPDRNGQTPIVWAARNGHAAVVKILLGRKGVNFDWPDSYGQTPITLATENGHEAVVKLLLGREDVDPDRPNIYGQTPISLAAENGHVAVVKMLLEQEDVYPDRPGNGGRTPISWAAGDGHEVLVKLLLEQEGINPDKPDHDGRTPISWAAGNGHEAVVDALLGRAGANPDSPSLRDPPLISCAETGHEVVSLEREDVYPDRPDHGGRTPISWAAENGRVAVVELLAWRSDVRLSKLDNSGRTLTSWATKGDHEAVVDLLLRAVYDESWM